MNWTDHDHRGDYADTQHSHGFYDLHDVAEEHHRHYDHESEIAGLREDLGRALERIRDLEDRVRQLEAEHEADVRREEWELREGSRLAERDAYIGTWSGQDVTRRENR